jgi:hypothetical protein
MILTRRQPSRQLTPVIMMEQSYRLMGVFDDPRFVSEPAVQELLRGIHLDPSKPRDELHDDFLKLPSSVRDRFHADYSDYIRALSEKADSR